MVFPVLPPQALLQRFFSCTAFPQAPLQQYNSQLVAKATQRQAMRSAADVSIRKGRGKKGQEEDEEEEVRKALRLVASNGVLRVRTRRGRR